MNSATLPVNVVEWISNASRWFESLTNYERRRRRARNVIQRRSLQVALKDKPYNQEECARKGRYNEIVCHLCQCATVYLAAGRGSQSASA